MKNTLKLFGIIALIAVIGFGLVSCGDKGGGGDLNLTGTITVTPNTGTITTGTKLTATYDGSETVNYQWNKNRSAIGGETSTAYTPTEEGSYTVTVSATGYKSKDSNAVTVTVPIGPQWTAVTDSKFGSNSINAIAFGNGLFVAGGDKGTMATSTDGVTWSSVSDTKFDSNNIRAIAFGNGSFVAGGVNGIMATSTDGVTWTAVTTDVFTDSVSVSAGSATITSIKKATIRAIAYDGNNTFVAGGGYSYNPSPYSLIDCTKLAYSTDGGTTWTEVKSDSFIGSIIYAIAYGNGKFVAVGFNKTKGLIATSTDCTTWTAITDNIFNSFDTLGNKVIEMIVFGNGMFVAGSTGSEGKLASSTDGLTWTIITDTGGLKYGYNTITYGNGKFVVGDYHGNMLISSDCKIWTDVSDSKFGKSPINAIAYGNNKFVAGGDDGKMAYSSDN